MTVEEYEAMAYSFAKESENKFDAAARVMISGFEILYAASENEEDYEVFLNYLFDIAANISNRRIH